MHTKRRTSDGKEAHNIAGEVIQGVGVERGRGSSDDTAWEPIQHAHNTP